MCFYLGSVSGKRRRGGGGGEGREGERGGGEERESEEVDETYIYRYKFPLGFPTYATWVTRTYKISRGVERKLHIFWIIFQA